MIDAGMDHFWNWNWKNHWYEMFRIWVYTLSATSEVDFKYSTRVRCVLTRGESKTNRKNVDGQQPFVGTTGRARETTDWTSPDNQTTVSRLNVGKIFPCVIALLSSPPLLLLLSLRVTLFPLGEGGRKGHTTSPICFRVCQLGDSNYRRLEEEDRKRMSNWFGFPPKLHICCCSSSKKRPWVIVTLDLDASSFYLLLFFSLLFDAV